MVILTRNDRLAEKPIVWNRRDPLKFLLRGRSFQVDCSISERNCGLCIVR